MEMKCNSCQVIKQSCSSHVYINIILANRGECVLFIQLSGLVYMSTYMHTGSLNFRFHKSYWPFSVWPGSHGARPAQAGENRFNKSAQWGSKHEASICSGLWFSLRVWHDVFSGYRKTHSLALRNVASECNFPWFFCMCEFWRRTLLEPHNHQTWNILQPPLFKPFICNPPL